MFTRIPLTVVVCTLNEAHHIEKCITNILVNLPAEILVIDASSDDDTLVRCPRSENVYIHRTGRLGLLHQRLYAARQAKYDTIAFIDADDFIEPKSLAQNYQFMLDKGLDGVMFRIRAYSTETWWQKGWDVLVQLLTEKSKQIDTLGRPCITRRDHLLLVAEPAEPIYTEDTYIAMTLARKLGSLKFMVGPGLSMRDFPSNFSSNLEKFIKYGEGDYQNMVIHKKYVSLVFHQLIRYPVLRGLSSFRYSKVHLLFFFVVGFFRFYGTVKAAKTSFFRRIFRDVS